MKNCDECNGRIECEVLNEVAPREKVDAFIKLLNELHAKEYLTNRSILEMAELLEEKSKAKMVEKYRAKITKDIAENIIAKDAPQNKREMVMKMVEMALNELGNDLISDQLEAEAIEKDIDKQVAILKEKGYVTKYVKHEYGVEIEFRKGALKEAVGEDKDMLMLLSLLNVSDHVEARPSEE